MADETTLKRSLNLPMLTFYGLGTIVGGGFYALTGKVAAEAGMLTPVAFLTAAAIALFSAFSFGELSARFPYSAGESHYVFEAFGRRWLSGLTGWLVIATGVVSAATLANAFAAFVRSMVDLPHPGLVVFAVLGLGLLTAWGINESAIAALVITVIETGMLIFIFLWASPSLATVPAHMGELVPAFAVRDWSGILLGAYLAFYSFVGFEDMVNIAEEVKEPSKTLPRAILLSLGMTAILYFGVTLVTVLSTSQQSLIESDSPLSSVFTGEFGQSVVAVVGMLAGLNGALVQIVMASRVAYGMAEKGMAPKIFRRVHPRTRTPLESTLAITIVVLVLALGFPLVRLAEATSTILLLIYALVNLSLLRIKWRDPNPPAEGPCYPVWLPVVGAGTCLAFLVFRGYTLVAAAGLF